MSDAQRPVDRRDGGGASTVEERLGTRTRYWRSLGELEGSEEFRGWLADKDAAELAYAEYPDRGADEGYSYALLLECDPCRVDDLWEQYRAVTLKCFNDMPRPEVGGADPEEG